MDYFSNYHYGYIKCDLEKIIKEKGFTRKSFIKESRIKHEIVNKYCDNVFFQIDFRVLSKFCYILNCRLEEIIYYVPPKNYKIGSHIIRKEKYEKNLFGCVNLDIMSIMIVLNLNKYHLSQKAEIKYDLISNYCIKYTYRIDVINLAKLCYTFRCNLSDILYYNPPIRLIKKVYISA